jgi:hypothetical protein
MSVKKGMPTAQIELAGKRYDLRYDIDSMAEIEGAAEDMERKSFYALLDAPYTIREQAIMLMAGINGARRDKGETALLDADGSKALLQSHFDYLREKQMGMAEWRLKMSMINLRLMEAARLGAGLVPPSISKKEPEAENELPSATNSP